MRIKKIEGESSENDENELVKEVKKKSKPEVILEEKEKPSLKERAKELAEELDKEGKGIKAEDIKFRDLLPKEKQKELIVPLEDYVKAGIHLGTKVISGNMRQFVYRRRADGLAILNTNLIDTKLREAIKVLEAYEPERIMLACKREAGWTAAKKFSEITGARAYTKKYPAGIITNPKLEDFFEPGIIMVCDPWIDKNASNDGNNIRVPVIGLCDTNNLIKGLNHFIPCNNKSNKSIGMVLYIIAKHYCQARGIKFDAQVKDFTGEEL